MMSTPKRQVSFLESFPPDIWAHFAWYLSGEQIGRLTITGATHLCQRLKSPTVVKSIILGYDFIIFKSFPAFLRELPSLEELMIHSCDNEWSDKLGMRIDMLPSGLRKLELTGHWRKACELFGELGAPLMLCKHLPRLEIFNLSCFGFDDYSWMIHSPPSLTSVRLPRWNGDVELPSSLIDFEAYESKISRRSFVSKLPPRLESLTMYSRSTGIDLVIPLLPPSTRRLSSGIMRCRMVSKTPEKLIEQLPKSLTWLQLGEWKFKFESNPELVSLLPPTLKTLDTTKAIPCSAWHLLPQQLTDLTFKAPRLLCTAVITITDNHGIPHEVRSVPFDSLPRSITRLHLFPSGPTHFCGPRMSTKSYFPPNLTSLIIPNIHLSPENAKLWPSSLTHLKIRNLCERVCEHLPNHLKILIANKTLMSPNLIKFLPKSLTTLNLYLVDPEDPWFDYNFGEAIDHVSALPEYTIHEDCMSKSFDWKDASPLPSTLTDFSIGNAKQLGDSFLKYQQLPHLLKLEIQYSLHFTDLSIPILPFNLTTLFIAPASCISGKSFPTLPRYLTYLCLLDSEKIFDYDIQHLPRTLKTAELNSAIHLTDLCVPDLPRHLETLRLQNNSKITPSSFPLFPYALRSSQRSSTALFAKWQINKGLIEHY